MLAPITHISPVTAVRRVRLLPVDGRVLVRPGQKVVAMDVLAEAHCHPKHMLLDVRQVLGGGSSARAKELVERNTGETVQAGDIIASTGGVLRRQIRAPHDGVIAANINGQVFLRVSSEPDPLKSGFTGLVCEIIPERGAILETNGALVQGVWGNRHINSGQLMLLADGDDDTLRVQHFDGTPEQLRGKVVFATYCDDAAVLQEAERRSLRGLILGSMPSRLIETASALQIPLILLEGFGRIPVNRHAREVLQANRRRQVALNAAAWDNFIGERPEISIPLAVEGKPAREAGVFTAGQNVRIHMPPYNGRTGILDAVLPGTSLLPSGLRAAAAQITLDDGENVLVPVANLDVIE